MRRALGALLVTIVGVVWLVTFKVTPLQVDAVTAPTPASRTREPATPPPGRTAAPAPTIAPGLPATSGTFTGATVNTIYGPVQVRITLANQKVVDVQALALPRERARSAAISQYSAPMLRTEAIQAQSANIDIVSGATYTSIAYARSLDSALKQAHLV
jgi:uncharacterized protein with FMN-binding domain